ncbi:hypothetical protein B5X24_HaOG207104 [Helicoverpa armigera]|uniref:Uncharacterized protein n=1 Tax=Helicoverpa armigera TaxID=29058 RepID=A0A2W1BQ40_HELAM|nr:hypothetical protein B5X24_HaOG207104 [Helicoverpa armigera]
MSMNLTAKLDDLQRGDRQLETTVALCEIRTQLQELTKSVESCQSEVSEVKRDMVAIKQELDTVQQVKEEIEELREYVDRLEEHSQRRKLRLLEQVRETETITLSLQPISRNMLSLNMPKQICAVEIKVQVFT